MNKLNCWEILNCGREPGGRMAAIFGPCPAATIKGADGINGGSNGGRVCWAVAGTYCGQSPDGTLAKKMKTCQNCKVYKLIISEEGAKAGKYTAKESYFTALS